MTQEKTNVDQSVLMQALEEGAMVLTGNARLSRALLAAFERIMLSRNFEAWPTPAVLPFGAWLVKAWEDSGINSGRSKHRLLTTQQEIQLWAGIIHEQNPGLLRVRATARRAANAWKLLREYHLDLADFRFGDGENSSAFRNWAKRFDSLCQTQGYVSASNTLPTLASAISTGDFNLTSRMIFTGFYELTPAQLGLVADLENAGCDVSWLEVQGDPGAAFLFKAADARHEMESAAQWARGILAESPTAQIGIVVPDLAALRVPLGNILARTLDPFSFQVGADSPARSWNISLGRRLADYPLVRSALDLLSLVSSPVRQETVGALLLSPYWGLPEDTAGQTAERERRALLDRKLRSNGDSLIDLGTIRYEAGRSNEDGVAAWASAQLVSCLTDLMQLRRELPSRAETGDWAAHFTEWLSLAAWVKGRVLDSEEYQTVEAWQKLLSVFSSLGDFAGNMSVQDALELLTAEARETIFQPVSSETPVQVLGLYEANGQVFDHLWVMGLHDRAWPPVSSPDPFIPPGLQSEAQLPHCDPQRELAMTVEMTGQLLRAAGTVVMSYPARQGDEELSCSPLVQALNPVSIDDLVPATGPGWQESIRRSASLEIVAEPLAIALQAPRVSGGSRVLSNQAACPFRAFADHRLGARPLDTVQAGLDAMRRGSLLHRVLELLWRELESQQRLLALDAAGIGALVRSKIAEAIEAQRKRSFHTLTDRYSKLEAERLEQQVLAWLELERARSPFRVVGFEEEKELEIGGILLRVFIDRIDQLEDGRQVIVDYKTGTVSPADWFGARPADLQLPLYSFACSDAPIAAVTFAQLRADGMAYRGVVDEAGILPNLPAGRNALLKDATANWPAVLDDWEQVLRELAQEFREGRSAIEPLKGLKTCDESYCELAPLCRIRESIAEESAVKAGGAGP